MRNVKYQSDKDSCSGVCLMRMLICTKNKYVGKIINSRNGLLMRHVEQNCVK